MSQIGGGMVGESKVGSMNEYFRGDMVVKKVEGNKCGVVVFIYWQSEGYRK